MNLQLHFQRFHRSKAGSSFGNTLSNFVKEGKNYHSTLIPEMEPIEIISSDSDFELEDVRETNEISSSDSDFYFGLDEIDETNTSSIAESTNTSSIAESTNSRILPPRASANPGNTGNGSKFLKVPSRKRAYASSGSFPNINNSKQVKTAAYSGSRDDIKASKGMIVCADDSKHFLENWNIGPPRSVNSRIVSLSGADYETLSSQQARKRTLPSTFQPFSSSNKLNNSYSKYFLENWNVGQPRTVNSGIVSLSGADYETLSSQQALKRTLPSTFQPFSSSSKLNNSGEIMAISRIRDSCSTSYNSAGPSLTSGKGYMREHFSWVNDDEVIMYDISVGRILPPTLVQTKSISASHISSDPVYRPGFGEPTISGNDERLIYQAALQDLNQPKVEANLPGGLLSVPLLRHQKIALTWMLKKETRATPCLGGILADDQGLGKTVSMIALIQMQRSLQTKPESENRCNHRSEALNLDDDDDNGTVGSEKIKPNGESEDVKPLLGETGTSSVHTFSKRRPAAGTLVVCPASVLRQWARELDEKVTEEAKLSVLVYHGGSSTRDPVELEKFDVVLTTYSIVTNEVPKQPLVDEDEAEEKNGEKYAIYSEFSYNKKRKKTCESSKKGKRGRKAFDSSTIDNDSGPLARVGWFRVILDEAQTIKNHRTQVARPCCSLRAKRRWCLSGTPIQNAIDDLYSYFRFLKYDPYSSYKSFYTAIKVPISKHELHGYKKLQAVLTAIMLCRTKGSLIDGEPIIKLPPKSVQLRKVDFSTQEWEFYKQLEADSRTQFKAYAAAGTLNQNYANILMMLLRLRQACDHPYLVKGYNTDSLGNVASATTRNIPRCVLAKLLKCLEPSTCIVCNDTPEDPVVTMCAHVFCYQCVSDYLTGDDNMCPAHECKEQLGANLVFSRAALRSCLSDDDGSSSSKNLEFVEKLIVVDRDYSSSKIKALLEILQTCCEVTSLDSELHCSTGPTKAIVFSQWTSMLDLVEISLKQTCIQYRRLDGTMSLISRDRAVKDFNIDPEITVMLMSLKAGNLGLNMVAACHIILLDLWWNPTTEDQAVDRAHRIGQTRPVTVTRITVKDTVEDRILALQEEKRKMVASVFGEDQSGSRSSRLTVDDLKYFFDP